ncbi:unnamed protein product [Periconia digitata]|uniref:Uncharacterized protein n=1 Tax=Periconia digitata TaxID=1303443 RepID=A0A9W4XQ57_9PLEO|nr:unnamed protein product [Periconia digitata]
MSELHHSSSMSTAVNPTITHVGAGSGLPPDKAYSDMVPEHEATFNERAFSAFLDVKRPESLLRRSSSMLTLYSQRQYDDYSPGCAKADFDMYELKDITQDNGSPCLDSTSPHLFHSSSQSRNPDSEAHPEAMQSHRVDDTKLDDQNYTGSWQSWRECTPDDFLLQSNSLSPEPWYSTTPRSHRGSKARTDGQGTPLRSSLKNKSRTTSTTPTEELSLDAAIASLRRVKTVNFEDTMAMKTVSLLPLNSKLVESDGDLDHAEEGRASDSAKNDDRSPLKPDQGLSYTFPRTKSTIADIEITKTNVHCHINVEIPTDLDTDYFAVVPGEDLPTGSKARGDLRSSSASQVLERYGSPTLHSLEKASARLANSSFRNSSQDHQFELKNVVLPYEDVDSDFQAVRRIGSGDGATRAPPNSKIASAKPSRLPSQSTGEHFQRTRSYDETNAIRSPGDRNTFSEQTFPLEVVLTHPAGDPEPIFRMNDEYNNTIEEDPLFRTLSNIDEPDIKFRGHRDSVTLERNSVLRSRRVTPELLAYGDSIADVRKRMHVRNHAASESRRISSRPMPATMESFGSLEHGFSSYVISRGTMNGLAAKRVD